MVGGMIAKKHALSILTASVGVSLNANSLTITVSFPVPFNVKYGRRKSDHAPVRAKIATTIIIGFESGSTIAENTFKTPHPSSFAASKSSFGIPSKNSLNITIWNAFAPAASQIGINDPPKFNTLMLRKREIILVEEGINKLSITKPDTILFPFGFNIANTYARIPLKITAHTTQPTTENKEFL